MKHYSKEFKEEALKLSDEIGVKKAAQQLGIAYYTLADWRSICPQFAAETQIVKADRVMLLDVISVHTPPPTNRSVFFW